MIEPVRPVGWYVASMPPALYALCQGLRCDARRCRPIWYSGIHLPLALRHRPSEAAAVPVSFGSFGGPGAASSPALKTVQPWQPWPSHPPFADEVTRWWPSDDWPPTRPAIVVQDQITQQPSEMIDYRAYGGLLNLWI